MQTNIKIDLDKRLKDGQPVIIELGCGQKKKPDRIGIDRVDLPNVDIVADIEKGLAFLPDNSVDHLHCRSVLEHLENFELVMREITRALKPSGTAHIYVPHFSNPYYYSDYTHKRPFSLYTFYYFVEPENQLRRKVPTFYSDIRIEITSIKFVFRSPFWLCCRLKKLFGRIINSCTWLQERYEQGLCYTCPADGIELTFKPQ